MKSVVVPQRGVSKESVGVFTEADELALDDETTLASAEKSPKRRKREIPKEVLILAKRRLSSRGDRLRKRVFKTRKPSMAEDPFVKPLASSQSFYTSAHKKLELEAYESAYFGKPEIDDSLWGLVKNAFMIQVPRGHPSHFAQITGLRRYFFRDFFTTLISMKPLVAGVVLGIFFFLTNVFFALLYAIGDDEKCLPEYVYEERLREEGGSIAYFYFYMSVQTLATIGYGELHPKSHYCNAISCLIAFTSIIYIAATVAIINEHVSKPKSRISFTKFCIIEPRSRKADGGRSRMLRFRIANHRNSFLFNGEMAVTMHYNQFNDDTMSVTRQSETLRMRYEKRGMVSLYADFSHMIDETSPLYGVKKDWLELRDVVIQCVFVCIDDDLKSTTVSHKQYFHDEIKYNYFWASINETPKHFDFSKFDSLIDVNDIARGLFDAADSDGKGYIEKQNFVDAVKDDPRTGAIMISLMAEETTTEELFDELDLNNDGQLDFDEFYAAYNKMRRSQSAISMTSLSPVRSNSMP